MADDEKGRETDWLEDQVDQILLNEADSFGFEEALEKLQSSTQRLVREVLKRQKARGTKQGRKGSPSSDINEFYPVVLWLVLNGVSMEPAWTIIQDRIPQRTPQNAKRQLNRARDLLEKAINTAASAVVDGNPRRFRTAYRQVRQLLE
jgi:site-specific recombinase XerC